MAALQHAQELFETWYTLSGFHYASLSYSPWQMMAEFSSEITQFRKSDDRTDWCHRQKDLAAKAEPVTPYLFQESPVLGDTYDVRTETYHKELLDTDNNRNKLKQLFHGTFPGSRIWKFESHNDNNDFLLRFTVYIPYSGIWAWKEKVLAQDAGKGETTDEQHK